ncbi:3-dehydroquinate synthase [Candidatus Peregrinibacteria bacterium CG_4_10_14_0_2_um_filter_43_11]|nr:MAG: 3-dehydroquinate synthase [Candidatus Peregrinibacteria bacterium CG_4_10_14_0_2_um_filter_43_11]
MSDIVLKTDHGISRVRIQSGGLATLWKMMKKAHPSSRFVVLTDVSIYRIYDKEIEKQFPKALILKIPSGEKQKQMETVMMLAEKMLNEGITKCDVLIGFGGGVITDIAGFIASIYMRGMPFVAVPTSLLCMVDAAIGGKNGVDFKAKNILGTIYLPELVLIDPMLLEKCPQKYIDCSMGEIVKYAVTLDTGLLRDFRKTPLNLEKIIKKSVQAKVRVVRQDLKESHLRKVLNFGHTFGHAIEEKSAYKLSHGEAISIGMMLANRVAQKLKKQKPSIGEKVEAILKLFHLPTTLPKGMTIDGLVDLMKKDKKRHGKTIDFVIITTLGRTEIISLTLSQLVKLVK